MLLSKLKNAVWTAKRNLGRHNLDAQLEVVVVLGDYAIREVLSEMRHYYTGAESPESAISNTLFGARVIRTGNSDDYHVLLNFKKDSSS